MFLADFISPLVDEVRMSMEVHISDIMLNGIPETWNDTMKMQSLYSLEEKGFTKHVTWKQSSIKEDTIGLFAEEPIHKGETYRICENMKNRIVFHEENDIPPLTEATKKYLSHYMFQTNDVVDIHLPGDSKNHDSDRANTTTVEIGNDKIRGIVTKDIEKGEELLLDYSEFGSPPKWFVDFVIKHDMLQTMPFKGYNIFV